MPKKRASKKTAKKVDPWKKMMTHRFEVVMDVSSEEGERRKREYLFQSVMEPLVSSAGLDLDVKNFTYKTLPGSGGEYGKGRFTVSIGADDYDYFVDEYSKNFEEFEVIN